MRARRTDPDRLRDLIHDRRMTLKAFGEAAELSQAMVSYVLAGGRDFSDRKARQVAEVLGCTLDDFTEPFTRPPRGPRLKDPA